MIRNALCDNFDWSTEHSSTWSTWVRAESCLFFVFSMKIFDVWLLFVSALPFSFRSREKSDRLTGESRHFVHIVETPYRMCDVCLCMSDNFMTLMLVLVASFETFKLLSVYLRIILNSDVTTYICVV